jgi:hypothetical protein
VAIRRYVSDPLVGAHTFSGTMIGQMRLAESAAGMNALPTIQAKVITNDGTLRRGILYGGDTRTTNVDELTTTLRSWRNPAAGISPVTLNSVNAQDGDRILIEVGVRANNTVTTSYTATLRHGSTATPGGANDLAAGGTETTDLNPWVEFSADLTFATTTRTARVPMETPAQSLVAGANTSELIVRAVKSGTGLYTPTLTAEIREGGVLKATPISAVAVPDSEAALSGLFNNSVIADPTAVEVWLTATDGSVAATRVNLVEWNAMGAAGVITDVAGQAYGVVSGAGGSAHPTVLVPGRGYAVARPNAQARPTVFTYSKANGRSTPNAQAAATRLRYGRGYGNPKSTAAALSGRLRGSRAYASPISAGSARGGTIKAGRAFAIARAYGMARAGVTLMGRAYGVADARGAAHPLRDRPGEAFGVGASFGSAHPIIVVYGRAYGRSAPFGIAKGGRIAGSRAYGRAESFGHIEFARIVSDVFASAYGRASSSGFSRPYRGKLSRAAGAAETAAAARAIRDVAGGAYGLSESYAIAHGIRDVAAAAYAVAESRGFLGPAVVVIPGADLVPDITVALIPTASGDVEMVPIAVGDVQIVPTANGEVEIVPMAHADAELRPTAGAEVELEE